MITALLLLIGCWTIALTIDAAIARTRRSAAPTLVKGEIHSA